MARIVGRDTRHLDADEISRAVVETVAESCSDGVIAPLFYMAIGGVPLAMAYKTINTLDSMIGHADERYFYFGKVAARLDDAVNFLPSRLTALGITATAAIVAGASSATALDTWLRDGMKHKSPNAGQPESAMAGALQVRLGGENSYKGEPVTHASYWRTVCSPLNEKGRTGNSDRRGSLCPWGLRCGIAAKEEKMSATPSSSAAGAWRTTSADRCAV